MRTEDRVNLNRCGIIAAAIAVTVGLVFTFFGDIIASAVTSNTNTQVAVEYYTGKPSSDISYEEAYLNGDSNVQKVSYTTKSKGRLQWGEPSANGEYEVYYDAADVHLLAAYLNESEEQYIELYNKYLEAKKAVLE